MIPPVDQQTDRYPSVLLAFWIACILAAAGGVAPLFFGGTSNRMAGTVIPFGIAAGAMALNALLPHQGRTVPTLLYFLAGLAIVYAMLAMIVVPLQLAVLGACPPAPETCQAGQQPGLTAGESDGLAAGITFGLLAIGSGFVGLAMLYRRKPRYKFTPTTPALRSRPAMGSKAAVSEPKSEPAEAAPGAVAATAAAAVHEAPPKPEPPAEPEAVAEEPAAPLELAAPEEMLELPAPELEPQTPTVIAPESAPAPTPARKPRTRHPRQPRPEAPAESSPEPPASDPPST